MISEEGMKNLYIVFLLFMCGLFVYLLVVCRRKHNETFCNCKDMDTQVYVNKDLLHDLYNEGELTEYSKFVNKGWSE